MFGCGYAFGYRVSTRTYSHKSSGSVFINSVGSTPRKTEIGMNSGNKHQSITVGGCIYYGSNVVIQDNVMYVDGVKQHTNVSSLACDNKIHVKVSNLTDSLICSNVDQLIVEGNVGKNVQMKSGTMLVKGSIHGGVECKTGTVTADTIRGSVSVEKGSISHNTK